MRHFRCTKLLIFWPIIIIAAILLIYLFGALIDSEDHQISRNRAEMWAKAPGSYQLLILPTELYGAKTLVTRQVTSLPVELRSEATVINFCSSTYVTTDDRKDGNTYNMSNFLVEQIRRMLHISNTCESMKKEPHSLFRSVAHIIINKEDALTFCPIYKAASTSWSIMILEMRGLWNGIIGDLLSLLKKHFNSGAKIVKKLVPKVNETDRLIIVRHPFERLVSCYRDKYENNNQWYYFKKYGFQMIFKHRNLTGLSGVETSSFMREVEAIIKNKTATEINLPLNPFANPPYPTFEEFSKYLATKAPNNDDEHWKPYYHHCSICELDYNFILKFEDLKEESEMMLKYLNKTSETSYRWDNPTKGEKTNSDIVCPYFSQISLELATKLMKKYEKDFSLFEYDPTQYLNCAINNTGYWNTTIS